MFSEHPLPIVRPRLEQRGGVSPPTPSQRALSQVNTMTRTRDASPSAIKQLGVPRVPENRSARRSGQELDLRFPPPQPVHPLITPTPPPLAEDYRG